MVTWNIRDADYHLRLLFSRSGIFHLMFKDSSVKLTYSIKIKIKLLRH